jgi:hypothetical protein
MISNHVITGVVKILKRDGKDLSVHKKAASDGDIHKLYTRGVFNIATGQVLSRGVAYILTSLLVLRESIP